MTVKGKYASFLDNDEWLDDLAFLVDVTNYLADLNVKLQGKDQYVSRLYEHVQVFIRKLDLIQQQLSLKKVFHFTTLSTRCADTVNHNKYFVLLGGLTDEFRQRFADFRKYSKELKLFADPFGTCATDADDKYQLELIEIQSGSDLKRAFAGHDLLTFYR